MASCTHKARRPTCSKLVRTASLTRVLGLKNARATVNEYGIPSDWPARMACSATLLSSLRVLLAAGAHPLAPMPTGRSGERPGPIVSDREPDRSARVLPPPARASGCGTGLARRTALGLAEEAGHRHSLVGEDLHLPAKLELGRSSAPLLHERLGDEDQHSPQGQLPGHRGRPQCRRHHKPVVSGPLRQL